MSAIAPNVRLALSRSRLQRALQEWKAEQEPEPHAAGNGPAWLHALRSEPGTRVLLDALSLWWGQQPWHRASVALVASANQWLHPLAQRKPVMLVLGAAALGGALMLLRPWRWLSLTTVAAGVLPQLLPKLLAVLRPFAWADMLNGWLKPGAQSATAPPSTTEPPMQPAAER